MRFPELDEDVAKLLQDIYVYCGPDDIKGTPLRSGSLISVIMIPDDYPKEFVTRVLHTYRGTILYIVLIISEEKVSIASYAGSPRRGIRGLMGISYIVFMSHWAN
jgi:hypothetical protein